MRLGAACISPSSEMKMLIVLVFHRARQNDFALAEMIDSAGCTSPRVRLLQVDMTQIGILPDLLTANRSHKD